MKSEKELDLIVDNAMTALGCTTARKPTYRHKRTGNLYIAETIVLSESDLVPYVMYRKRSTFIHFIRPLQDFLGRFEAINEPG